MELIVLLPYLQIVKSIFSIKTIQSYYISPSNSTNSQWGKADGILDNNFYSWLPQTSVQLIKCLVTSTSFFIQYQLKVKKCPWVPHRDSASTVYLVICPLFYYRPNYLHNSLGLCTFYCAARFLRSTTIFSL